jgi:hypothetical protein
MSDPGLLHGLSSSEGKSASRSVDVIGLPVVGWIGSASTSTVDVWMAGYAVPGFSVATGLPCVGAAAPVSTCEGIEGVAGFISAEADRSGSFATAVCRRCALFRSQ